MLTVRLRCRVSRSAKAQPQALCLASTCMTCNTVPIVGGDTPQPTQRDFRKYASAGPAISFHIVLIVVIELYELFPELSCTLKATHMLRPRPFFLTRAPRHRRHVGRPRSSPKRQGTTCRTPSCAARNVHAQRAANHAKRPTGAPAVASRRQRSVRLARPCHEPRSRHPRAPCTRPTPARAHGGSRSGRTARPKPRGSLVVDEIAAGEPIKMGGLRQ